MRKHGRPYRLAVLVMVLFLSVGALAARLAYADPTGQGGEAGGQEQQPDGGEEQPQDGDPDQQQDGGQGQQPHGWWETFNPLDWVGTITEKVTESVKQVITEEAVDATTAFVHAAFLPANVEMLTLAGLAADRAPPGQVRAVRRLWSQLWWASVAVLVVAALVQAIRVAVDRTPDSGRARWVEWLLYPLAGAFMGRLSLFVVDVLVGVQNMLWRGALADATPCGLLYGYCDSRTAAMTGAGMVAGLFTWVITIIPVLVLSLLLAVNWVYLALAALAGPIYTALAAAGRTPEPMAGWLSAVVRSALVQSMVGVGLFVLVLFRSAGEEPSVAGAIVRGLDGAGMLRFAVVMMLDLAVVYWWLIPVFAATADLVTLKGGQVLESAGRFTGLVGAILAGAGVVTANPALIAAGQKTAMAGRAAGAAGASARQGAEARLHAQQQGAAGGWMVHVARGIVARPDGEIQSTARRAIAGLPPVAPYRVEHRTGLPPGGVRVTAAPGLATSAVGAMLGRGMSVAVESRDFRADVHDSSRLWEALAPALAGDDGPVKKDGQQVRTDGLGAAEQAAVAAALKAAGVAHQVTLDGVAVAAADAVALRRAAARAVTGAREVGDQIRFTLPQGRVTAALAVLDKARIHVETAGGPFQAVARLKGKQAPDADAARNTAEKALAAAEQNALGERPGYYRHGARYVVIRLGQPVTTMDRPPDNGVFLGEWPIVTEGHWG